MRLDRFDPTPIESKPKSKKTISFKKIRNNVKVVPFSVLKRRDILPLLKEIKRLYSSVRSITSMGEPLPLQGNHMVLICNGPYGVKIKIYGHRKIIFIIRHLIGLIKDGILKESDELRINEIAITYV